ncbi:MAG: CcmD family protein [Ferruginibacter sp.]
MNLRKYIFRTLFSIAAMLCSFVSFAEPMEMADQMRSNGKIYVVVAVCLVILIGLFLYVMNVDRKVRKLEKENKSQ